MKTSTIIKCAVISASLPLFAGCVERQVVYSDPQVAAAPGEVVVADPGEPPAPQAEVMTVAPGSLDVWFWTPGSWEWRGHWVWFGGRWAARPHPGAVWVRSGWVHHGHGRVWVTGHWR